MYLIIFGANMNLSDEELKMKNKSEMESLEEIEKRREERKKRRNERRNKKRLHFLCRFRRKNR